MTDYKKVTSPARKLKRPKQVRRRTFHLVYPNVAQMHSDSHFVGTTTWVRLLTKVKSSRNYVLTYFYSCMNQLFYLFFISFPLISSAFSAHFANVDVTHIQSNRNFCNKIWQAFKFCQFHWPEGFSPLPPEQVYT